MDEKRPDRALEQGLCDAGCDADTLRCFCELEGLTAAQVPARAEQIRLLVQHRKKLLEQVHVCQKELECVDYLIYRLREAQEGRENHD